MMRRIVVSLVMAASAATLQLPATAGAEAPPNCTAADLAGVAGGVTMSTSAYLFTHPEVNTFLTGLEGLPPEQAREQALAYMDAPPQIAAELRGIRQPLTDFRARCGMTSPIQHDVLD